MDKTAEQLYTERQQRVKDAIQLKEPDRVPIMCYWGGFPLKQSGVTAYESMYDYEKVMNAWPNILKEYQPDMIDPGFGEFFLGPLFESLDYQMLKWPGHGFEKDATSAYQYHEKEVIKSDELDDFIFDPTDFMIRKFWPSVFGALKPLEQLPPLNEILSYYMGPFNFAAFADPDIQNAFKAIFNAGEHANRLIQGFIEQAEIFKNLGFPPSIGSGTQAPFDTISDFFRGTTGAMLDMFRCPDKLLNAIEKVYPIMLNTGLLAKQTGCPGVIIPLHKGLDSFMSPKQFKTFYWPSLKRLIVELIDEDLTPILFWEGDVTSRFDIIKDIPPGKAIYYFEQSDIFKAKEVFGDVVCIRGNVPLSLLMAGTTDEVKQYCKKLIDVVGKGGGVIMDCSTEATDAKPENLKAMFEFTREYGVYR